MEKSSPLKQDLGSLIKQCQQHSGQTLSLLEQLRLQSTKGDVDELVQTTKQIQILLGKLKDYGEEGVKELNDENKRLSEVVFNAICKYERKIVQMQRQGSLLKFITQARLRGKIDRLSTEVFSQVSNLEKEIRKEIIEIFTGLVKEDFVLLFADALQDTSAASNSGPRNRSTGKFLRTKDEVIRQEMGNIANIVTNPIERNQQVSRIPKLFVKSMRAISEIGSVWSPSDPTDESERTYSDTMWGRSISTYPRMSNGMRFGDPICDMFGMSYYDNRAIIAVADGCGWGPQKREAAARATRMFVQFMKANQNFVQNTLDAAVLVLQAFSAAHKSITHNHNADYILTECGTTTLLGGIVVELTQPQGGNPFAFVFASVGDCKGYIWRCKTGHVEEFTKGNRRSNDAKDPGGRIGPWIDNVAPDLRNLTVSVVYCDEGDILTVVSDGVHDNLDPKNLGLMPTDIGLTANNWEELNSQDAVWKWSENLFLRLAEQESNNHTPTCATIGKALIKHVLETTSYHRGLVADSKPVPPNPADCPGKLDHTTAVCLKLGSKKSWIKANLSTSSERIKMNAEMEYAIPTSPPKKKEDFKDLLDLPCVLDGGEEDSDPDRPIWNNLFGANTYLVSWSEFIAGLRMEITPQEEEMLKTIIDYSNAGSVTRVKFLEFLKGFGPLSDCIDNVKRTVSAIWFQGFITSNESKLFLLLKPVGTFLMRFSSSRPGSFVLDYVREAGQIRSVRLNSHPNGGFVAPIEGGDNRVFRSLDEIVDTYTGRSILRFPFTSTLPQQPWFFGDITEEDANSLLSGKPAGTFLVRFSQKVIGCFTACFVGQNGEVCKGLFTPAPGGYRVSDEGFVFGALEDIIDHYIAIGIFTQPLTH